ncbi:MAG: UDP-N-acetylmuramoyl-tripeptide--D-alanyl-D-alanine ligase [Cyclobacteriaceae bacterium]|nr:UDP-N-acetylmuramoyl-tripeptide--D-alanyl-D-alanine ligase [Cyclobacteriaceae bacterium]
MQIEQLYQRFLESGKISTDTRQISEGSLFFALRGDKFNANEFASQALDRGASCCVIDDARFAQDNRCILVDDVLKTLQDLARYHRSKLTIPVIGLTGSNGKTTSKELVLAVLSKKFNAYATKGNLNNHIGVPLTVLAIDHSYDIAIVEMGANHVGEIALLCSIANPTHGFITNIGKAHIGTFGGFENIIRGKSELYQHLITSQGTVFINSQNPILGNMARRFRSPYFYPAEGDYYHARLLDADPFIRYQSDQGEVVQTQITGAYNFENIAVALCIGKYFGVDEQAANQAVAAYVPVNMRSQIIKKDSNTIIMDAYNANPSSMEAAIQNLASLKASHKVAIVGDMFELEQEAQKEHARIGELLKEKNFDRVYLCGSLMKSAKEKNQSAFHFETKELLVEELKRNPISNSTILVKASRGIGLETVVEYL